MFALFNCVDSYGQVTIPKEIRDALGMRPGDQARFDRERGDRAILRKAEPSTLTEILGRLGPSKESAVRQQQSLRREWAERSRRHYHLRVGTEPHRGRLRRLLDRIDAGRAHGLVSIVTVAEVRAGLEPAEARAVWQVFLSHPLTSPNYSVEAVDGEIAEAAGALRRKTRLTLPGALIAATGKVRKATAVVARVRRLGHLGSMLRACGPSEVE